RAGRRHTMAAFRAPRGARGGAGGEEVRGLAALITLLSLAIAHAQQRPDRSHPPSLGPAPQLRIPAIEKRTLSNGLPVWIVEQNEVPLAQVNLVIHAGSGDDPVDAFGLASFTAAMLDEGAGARSALQ